MNQLLAFIIKNITGSDDFEISEESSEDGKTSLLVLANPEIIGLIIGKEGKTIKNIRRIVSIKAALTGCVVNISVNEK